MKIITPFPDFRQTYGYDCGAEALHAVLAFYGIDVKENDVMERAGTTARGGTSVEGIKKAAHSFGLKTKSGKMTIEEIKKYIDKDIPVLICLQAWTNDQGVDWEKDWRDGHWVVAIGYDQKKFYFEDPSTCVRDFLTFNEFIIRWHDEGANSKKYVGFGIAIYGKKRLYNPSKPIHMD